MLNEAGIVTDLGYEYYPDGIRGVKTVDSAPTVYLVNSGYVVAEYRENTLTSVYLWGANLIKAGIGSETSYYLYNAHGDVVQLTDEEGAVTKSYLYDAFGVEDEPSAYDLNPFRYCGEYYDRESGTYYLRARYYNPGTGRFTQEDPHWNPGNMIYGDHPQKINEREDALGLKTYAYAPDIEAIIQHSNLYTYAINTPTLYKDANGEIGVLASIAISAGVGALIGGGVQIFNNIMNGEAWTTGLGRALLAGAVGGAISAIPIPGVNAWISVVITGASGNVVGQLIAGEINSMDDVVEAIGVGAVTGLIGKSAADLLSATFQSHFKVLTKVQQKSILSNIGNISNRELTAIRQAFKNGIDCAKLDELIEKYGLDVVVSAFVSSTNAAAVQ